MRTTSHKHSPKTSASFGHEGTRKPANKAKSKLRKKKKKASCIIGGESETLGFHQETTEE